MAGVIVGSGQAGPGRPKGVPNKLTADIKAMILGALEAKGGQKYLEEQADKNPIAFMGLIAKVLPMQVSADPDNPLFPTEIKVKVVRSGS